MGLGKTPANVGRRRKRSEPIAVPENGTRMCYGYAWREGKEGEERRGVLGGSGGARR